MNAATLPEVSTDDAPPWQRAPANRGHLDDRERGAGGLGRPTALAVDTLTTEDGVRALETEWNALEQTSGTTLPFRTAAWTLAWWTHLRRHSPGIRDTLALRTIRTQDGELVGVAPLMVTECPGVGFLRTRR